MAYHGGADDLVMTLNTLLKRCPELSTSCLVLFDRLSGDSSPPPPQQRPESALSHDFVRQMRQNSVVHSVLPVFFVGPSVFPPLVFDAALFRRHSMD